MTGFTGCVPYLAMCTQTVGLGAFSKPKRSKLPQRGTKWFMTVVSPQSPPKRVELRIRCTILTNCRKTSHRLRCSPNWPIRPCSVQNTQTVAKVCVRLQSVAICPRRGQMPGARHISAVVAQYAPSTVRAWRDVNKTVICALHGTFHVNVPCCVHIRT